MVIHGDIVEENSEVMSKEKSLFEVKCDSLDAKTPMQFKERLSQMHPGEFAVQEVGTQEIENCLKYVIHYKVPLFRINSDLDRFYRGYKDCLKKANDLGAKMVSIDDCCGKLPPLPKQYNAEVLLKSIMHYLEENPETNLQFIKVASMSNQNVKQTDTQQIKFIVYELDKYLEEIKDSEYAQKRRKVFFSFINPSEGIEILDQILADINLNLSEQEMNKNNFSFSDIKLVNKLDEDDSTKNEA